MNHQDHGLFRYEQTKTIQKINYFLSFKPINTPLYCFNTLEIMADC